VHPKGRRVTEAEIDITRDAHKAGKSGGEILGLLDDRTNLHHLIRVAVGSRRANRDDVKKHTFTVSGRWAPSELELLASRLSEGATYWKIAAELDRSLPSIECRALMLNAERFPKRAWSAEDMSLLRTQFVQGKSVVDIARDMKRSTASVNTRITKMGLRRGSGSSVQHWSDEDVHAMEHHYKSGCSDKVIAEKLSFQVSWEAVKRKRERLGLTSWRFPTVQTPWSDADLDELRALAASQ